ncbi:unnamed protein product [Caenorhabditis auriculariae]|uniref:SAP domain-containing protein n=1 Tax=Caenorhabditis auriculariae TaxID=2777116 RepID=A0A8S1GXM4_9PELO|nr:unnamed protein product [Caenorhabditis auriculariae]
MEKKGKGQLPEVGDVFEMKVEQLKKVLKKHRLSTAGKKSDLQFRVVEFLSSLPKCPQVQPTDENSEPFEPMETCDPYEKANYSKEEENRKKMMSELGLEPADLIVKNRRKTSDVVFAPVSELKEDSERTFVIEDVTGSETSTSAFKTPEPKGRPLKNLKGSASKLLSIKQKFANAHAKLTDKMETLEERQVKISKRHEELTGALPTTFQRLATPKSARKRPAIVSVPQFDPNVDPTTLNFKFGQAEVTELQSLQKPFVKSDKDVRPARKEAVRLDVKAAAKAKTKGKAPTRIAAPQASCVTPIRSTGPQRTFTPHTGTKKKVFVDTTVLSDREFALAREEGLLPGTQKKKLVTNAEQRNIDRKKRREEIVAIKRKLKIEN